MWYKDLIQMFKFNFKILINIKTIICTLVFCIIPLILSIEVWDRISIIALFEINLPLVAVILCCDLANIEDTIGCSEVYDINCIKKSRVLLIRAIIQIIVMLIMVFILYFLIIIKLRIVNSTSMDTINFLTILYLFISNCILMMCISSFVTLITRKSAIGIMITFFYWIIWQVGVIHNIFNPFAYTIGLINYNQNKIINLLFSMIIFLITMHLYNKKHIYKYSDEI